MYVIPPRFMRNYELVPLTLVFSMSAITFVLNELNIYLLTSLSLGSKIRRVLHQNSKS